jgi:hypothetical protein
MGRHIKFIGGKPALFSTSSKIVEDFLKTIKRALENFLFGLNNLVPLLCGKQRLLI